MDPYQILHLPPTASREQVRASYRALARRWHPDRFQEGPERDWANDKMAQINAAYHECLSGAAPRAGADEKHMLTQIEQMIDSGRYEIARRQLMALTMRSAEWNYLFGVVLTRLRETEKAIIYLEVAVHQAPDSRKYAKALEEAQNSRRRFPAFVRRR
ncbi:MAG: J domain-containing protein [Clostridia bacterium]|nr:J domain-containing protein [Clostridia bacterium]